MVVAHDHELAMAWPWPVGRDPGNNGSRRPGIQHPALLAMSSSRMPMFYRKSGTSLEKTIFGSRGSGGYLGSKLGSLGSKLGGLGVVFASSRDSWGLNLGFWKPFWC